MAGFKPKNLLKHLKICCNIFERGARYIAAAVLVILTLMIVIDVFLRYVFSKPLPASVESTELMLPYIVFFPMAITLKEGSHVQINFLTGILRGKLKVIILLLINLTGIIVCALIGYESFKIFWHSFLIKEEMLAAIKLPWYLGKFAMPMGLFIFALRFFIFFINSLYLLKNDRAEPFYE